ncbi:MAG: type II toxin-antitoxin system VapC family toxin [Kiritimatiellae bacterium]|nr:type II toxin-antitoxin system VapC family toxin [Kiritimatiellia bacterium]
MRFWDASAIVPLLVKDEDTAEREAQLREDSVIVTWWATRVECASALCRLARDGGIEEDQLKTALANLNALADTWAEVLPSERVRSRALRLLRVHPLRAADALQLSACLAASDASGRSMTLVCADKRLCEAADKEGLTVVTG